MSFRAPRPRYFAIFGDMRTGSNLLEKTLDSHDGLIGLGELFNGAFIGGPGVEEAFGVTLDERNRHPVAFLEQAIAAHPGQTPGFRIFKNHDQRMIHHAATDPACAKIILTRNTLDSFLSLRIAQATNQWMVRKDENRRLAKVEFDGDEFTAYDAALAAHYDAIRRMMRAAGQSWFEITYDDLHDLDILNGAARFAGSSEAREAVAPRIIRQNPTRAEDKVSNPEALSNFLANRQSGPTLPPTATPAFTALNSLYVIRGVEVICAPIPGVADAALRDFLSRAQPSGQSNKLIEGLKGKQIERRRGRGSFVFSLVRHPSDRIRDVYQRFVVGDEAPEGLEDTRALLASHYGAPDDLGSPDAFNAFLDFIEDTVRAGVAAPYHPAWAPQLDLLAAYSAETAIDFVARAERIEKDAAWIAARLGVDGAKLASILMPALAPPSGPPSTPETERRIETIFAKDYARLGYKSRLPT